MTIETATYVSQLNASYPAGGDQKLEGDNHVRLIKTTLTGTFANMNAAVTTSAAELNTLVGAASTGVTTLKSVTKTARDNSTSVASTAYVDAAQYPYPLSLETTTAKTVTAWTHTHFTNGSASTATLPASPTSGDTVTLSFVTTAATIARNGKTINGASSNLTTGTAYACYVLRYDGTGWIVLSVQ
jgi:hypothetical protein